MSRYLMVLLLAGVFPLLLSFYPRLHFYKHKRALFLSIGLIVVIFGSWDIFATFRGHWYFNPQGVGKLWIVNLPLEEWLFFIVIPFCCIFSWEVVQYYKKKLK